MKLGLEVINNEQQVINSFRICRRASRLIMEPITHETTVALLEEVKFYLSLAGGKRP